jgi:energy-coupling factor transporter ATP-binding protein EcfA2
MSLMNSLSTASVSTFDTSTESEASISSQSSLLKDFAEKFSVVIKKAAKDRNLELSVLLQRLPPVDICVFGRSGIGKSELIKAITHLDIPTSPQLDHVTQNLTEATTTIGGLQFRFWDTKGVDNWLDIDTVDNLFNDMKEKKVQPIFIIYCAAAGGRIDTDIVAAILKQFETAKIPICYVITNIYAASSDQLVKQIEGGRLIMDNVFETVPHQTGKFCFEYKNILKNEDNSVPNRQGILIGVNSCPFDNIMGTMPVYNIHELMNFLANNLNDEDFSKFVTMTMNNRDFWDRFSDAWRTRIQRITDALNNFQTQTVSFFKWLFRVQRSTSIVDI